ncbi:phage tail tape measure protein, TP901 family, core region [Roseivivax halotolerans]|uniref:Phage tail tape measure protein, TP901 family, core region n=1 Tax=Roseivivax halotolerans TaxID=93684 RepID=A0A1I5W4T8_9RHOB|nr:phage tail tape measure protein [Roseivivax halotolerans]SFQ14627.1 phage tail tape measure protein, TP901 family, core region [Roseivivax halotolerans]
MSDLNVALIMRLVDRVTGPLKDIQGELGQVERRTNRFAKAGVFAGKAMLGIGAAAATGTAAAIGQAASMEDAWSEANKTLEMTPDQLEALKNGVAGLATEIPIATRGLVEITGVAGQLGLRGRQDVLAFTEDAAKMAATFDVTAGQSAQMMGSWREQMGYTQDEVRRLADQINYLGNTTAADSAGIASYTTAVVGIAKEAGMAEETVLALGASMIASGRAPEVAATGLRAFMRTMTETADGMSSAEADIVKKIGLADEWSSIQTQFYTDAEGAIRRVVTAIETLPEADQNNAISKLFGEEAGRALGPLLGNVENLEKALGRIPQIKLADGSMQAEFEALSDDVVDNWRKVRNALGEGVVGYGDTFLDPINDALRSTLDFLTTLDERVTVFDRLGTSWDGFMAGIGGGQGAALLERLAEIRAAIGAFVFGTTDGDAGEELAGIFQKAEAAGVRVSEVIGDISEFSSAIAEGDWRSALGDVRAFFAWLGELVLPSFLLDPSVPEGLQTFVDGFTEPFERAKARLGDAWDQLGPVLENYRRIFSSIWELMSGLGSSGELDASMAGLDTINRILGTLLGFAVEGAARGIEAIARGLETITGTVAALLEGDWAGAGREMREWFEFLDDLIIPDLPDLGAVLDDALDFAWADVLPDWDWGKIIPEMPSLADLRGMFSFGGEEVDAAKAEMQAALDEARKAANGDFIPFGREDFTLGQDLVAEIEAGSLEVEAAVSRLRDARATLSEDDRDRAEEMIAILDGIEARRATLDVPIELPPPTQMPTIADVAADAEDVADLERKIAAVTEAAEALPPEIRAMVTDVEGILSGLDFTGHGQRMMNTLAEGIRAGTAEVIAATQAMAAQVSAALPTSPAVTLAAETASVPVQARAAGGDFGPGWLLTGEEGPELEYRSRGGFIAHHGQLQEMVAMSREVVQGMTSMPAIASAKPLLSSRAGGAARETRVSVGDIHIHAAPGMDERRLAREAVAELHRRARDDDDDALHDGGLFDA